MSSTQPEYDAIVIGGGPGGSTAATYLAQAGRKVVVLEKTRFPRFHIGESLLPYNHQLFEEMGVLESIEAAGFPVKQGAQFHSGNSQTHLKLHFANGAFTRHTKAYQVDRATFDDVLLKHAARSGAEVREGCTVSRVSETADQVSVEARCEGQDPVRLTARYVLDCSGRANMTGNQENLRVSHPQLRKVALFGHFENVKRDEGSRRGDTVIIRLQNKWFWIIPTGENRISVGLVMDQAEFSESDQAPAEVFDTVVASSPEMTDRMKEARLLTSIQVTSDFSYYNKRLVGKRLLRVGDAAGFMDPIFSAGVYLAMYSARLAAQAVLGSLDSQQRASRLFAAYEKRVFRALRYYWDMSLGFYNRSFMDMFMQPRKVAQVQDAVVAILAGELEGGWKVRWRRMFFFALVWIHKRRSLVPRLSFD